jgi:hypothetical protein
MTASYTRSQRTTNAHVRTKNPTTSPRYQRSAITLLRGASRVLIEAYPSVAQGRGKVVPSVVKAP